MKNFRVQIRAYGYYADFNVKSEDNEDAFNDALVDKLGEPDINWEKDGFSDSSRTWITYEEVIDATTSQRLIQAEEESRDRMGGSSAR